MSRVPEDEHERVDGPSEDEAFGRGTHYAEINALLNSLHFFSVSGGESRWLARNRTPPCIIPVLTTTSSSDGWFKYRWRALHGQWSCSLAAPCSLRRCQTFVDTINRCSYRYRHLVG